VPLLRQIEVSMAQGNATPVACLDVGISLQSYAMSCSTANLLQREGSADRHRAMAQALQHRQTALGAPIQAAGTPDIRTLGSPPR
jgi:hypothetical protein